MAPDAAAVMEPLDCPIVGSTWVVETTIFIPIHWLVDPRVTFYTPMQPFEFLAVIV